MKIKESTLRKREMKERDKRDDVKLARKKEFGSTVWSPIKC